MENKSSLIELLPETAGAAIETACIAAGAEVLAPAAGVLGTSIGRYILARFASAKLTFLRESKRQGLSQSDFKNAEELAAGALRYARAARDQAADVNLRILAQTMIGLARRQELWAKDFLKYADALAPLSRDELIVIGAMLAEDKAWAPPPAGNGDNGNVWTAVERKLKTDFPRPYELFSIATRAQRSGLIIGFSRSGGPWYEVTPLGRDVRQFVEIEEALQPEA